MRSKAAIDYRDYFENAVSYEKYLENFQAEISLGDASPFAQYLPQNWQRHRRLDRKMKISADLKRAIEKLQEPMNWLVITEHWCGDASQILPIIAKVASESEGKINLKLTYRDENPALMDAHLTDGKSRSIPILIQLNEHFKTLSTYGPRPAEAQSLLKELMAKNKEYIVPLHSWYAKDKQKSIQSDLLLLLESIH